MSLLCIIGLHNWNGCICKRCGKKRDIRHFWINGKCINCGQYSHNLVIIYRDKYAHIVKNCLSNMDALMIFEDLSDFSSDDLPIDFYETVSIYLYIENEYMVESFISDFERNLRFHFSYNLRNELFKAKITYLKPYNIVLGVERYIGGTVLRFKWDSIFSRDNIHDLIIDFSKCTNHWCL